MEKKTKEKVIYDLYDYECAYCGYGFDTPDRFNPCPKCGVFLVTDRDFRDMKYMNKAVCDMDGNTHKSRRKQEKSKLLESK